LLALGLVASGCSYSFDRFDRPCRDDSDCVGNGTCDALRSICAPAEYSSPQAQVETYAGTGDPSSADGDRDKASFSGPAAVAWLATTNSLIVAERSAHRLRAISATSVTTLGGSLAGFAEGALANARFTLPTGLWAFGADLYLADTGNHRVRHISQGSVRTLAGGAEGGLVDGSLSASRFKQPHSIARLADGRIVVSDQANHLIRVLDLDGDKVETLAGDVVGFADGPLRDARFRSPAGLALDASGRILVADSGNNRIRRIDLSGEGRVDTIAGGEAGFADGLAAEARFSSPQGLAVAAGDVIYVADTLNARVRRIANGEVSTVCGAGAVATVDGAAAQARLERPTGVALGQDGGVLYVADQQANRIRRVTLP
jgi:hypothetical protein